MGVEKCVNYVDGVGEKRKEGFEGRSEYRVFQSF